MGCWLIPKGVRCGKMGTEPLCRLNRLQLSDVLQKWSTLLFVGGQYSGALPGFKSLGLKTLHLTNAGEEAQGIERIRLEPNGLLIGKYRLVGLTT